MERERKTVRKEIIPEWGSREWWMGQVELDWQMGRCGKTPILPDLHSVDFGAMTDRELAQLNERYFGSKPAAPESK